MATKINVEKFLGIVNHLGLDVEEQKSTYKLSHGGQKDRAMYICKSTLISRIDISGFIHELGVDHPHSPTNRVKQWIDFSKPEIEVLKDFARVAKDGLIERLGDTILSVRGSRGTTVVNKPTAEEVNEAVLIACGE
jgi:hypothetical protein